MEDLRFVNNAENMTFGEAIKALKQGMRVCRKDWSDKGMWLKLSSNMLFARHNGSPIYDNVKYGELSVVENETAGWVIDDFIFMKTSESTFVPWLASQTDMLAEDWMTL